MTAALAITAGLALYLATASAIGRRLRAAPARHHHEGRHPVSISCAACGDEDGPFVELDGIYLCEACLEVLQEQQ